MWLAGLLVRAAAQRKRNEGNRRESVSFSGDECVMSVANGVVVFFCQSTLTHSLLPGDLSRSVSGVQRPIPMMFIWNEGFCTE
jgi:hypothetical protein